ncbi:MAG TPA: formate dehydrogenase accessory sulfurtransferase FdhD [Polyangiaceae bacterium]|nr:formate dehydrogenase accessory sulfurtransferase FdhD [Polyangiaceae bacterium]
MPSRKATGVTQRPAVRFGPAERSDVDDIAVEEPLEIRVAGDPLAITMRTPGDDRELTLGFLYAEGVIASVDDVGSAAHCGRVGEEGFGNVIDVLPAPGTALAPERVQGARRGTVVSAACGVCGRLSIDDLAARCRPIEDAATIDATTLAGLIAALRGEQRVFARTGGVHAAGLFDLSAQLIVLREDIGRHNAVDKVVGHLVLARALPARGRVLAVSGRASFEIVQKAVMAGIPILASVSAASSLAIDLAARMNVTLAAFVRDGAMNVYSGRERIVS